MKKKQLWILLLIIILTSFITSSCTQEAKQVMAANNGKTEIRHTPEKFLELFNLKTVGDIAKLKITIPESWQFQLGAYPEGLYWALVSEYSKDAGLDLTPFKGKTLEVWRYSLSDGLPAQDSQNNFRYPSNVNLLIDNNQVVGAWLAFNAWGIGPSVKQNYLEDITGLSFEEWFYKQDLLIETEENKDLAAMDPIQVLDAFCKAIEAGDNLRANACMSPVSLRDALTANLPDKRLYNAKFQADNSYIGNLIEAKLISYKLMDTATLQEIDSIGDRTEIEISAKMKIKWKENAFNSPDGMGTRFVLMRKYPNGWKLLGLATGP